MLNYNHKLLLLLCIILILCVILLNCCVVFQSSCESFKNEHHYHQNTNTNHDACKDDITDAEYLLHMIPHHQVAVDISLLLQKKTKWKYMQHILRKLIWTQSYEIKLMEDFLKTLPETPKPFYNNNTYGKIDKNNYIATSSDFIHPNKLGLTNTYCDPHFFNPEEHLKHLQKMILNDETYIEHMIPHHQVAVDMSKKLLKNTKNNFMINLAYRIIRNQQEEIILLNDLKSNNYKFTY